MHSSHSRCRSILKTTEETNQPSTSKIFVAAEAISLLVGLGLGSKEVAPGKESVVMCRPSFSS